MDDNIALLAQRLEAEEARGVVNTAKIERLQQQAAEIRGAERTRTLTTNATQKWAPWLGGLVFFSAAAFFGNFVLDEIKMLKEEVNVAQVRLEEKSQKISANVKSSISNKGEIDKHGDSAGHPKVNTRLAVLEETVKNIKVPSVGEINTKLTTIEGSITAQRQAINDLARTQVAMGKTVSSMRASTAAAFVEVETQIRGYAEVQSIGTAHEGRYVQLLWQKVFLETLPDLEPFSSNIPARATTQVGKVNGD